MSPFLKGRLAVENDMFRNETILRPTRALTSFNKAKPSDPAPNIRTALTFIAYKILKASLRKWLLFFFFLFFFYPIAEDIFNHCFVSKGGRKEVISVSLGSMGL